MPWTTKLLVIANRTVDSDELVEALRARAAAGPLHVTLVAPAETARGEIEGRLGRALERLTAAEIPATGSIGHRDPIVAVQETWDPRRFDEVVVATLPADESRWLSCDLPRRVERLTGARVTHVVAAAEAAGRTSRAYA